MTFKNTSVELIEIWLIGLSFCYALLILFVRWLATFVRTYAHISAHNSLNLHIV